MQHIDNLSLSQYWFAMVRLMTIVHNLRGQNALIWQKNSHRYFKQFCKTKNFSLLSFSDGRKLVRNFATINNTYYFYSILRPELLFWSHLRLARNYFEVYSFKRPLGSNYYIYNYKPLWCALLVFFLRVLFLRPLNSFLLLRRYSDTKTGTCILPMASICSWRNRYCPKWPEYIYYPNANIHDLLTSLSSENIDCPPLIINFCNLFFFLVLLSSNMLLKTVF